MSLPWRDIPTDAVDEAAKRSVIYHSGAESDLEDHDKDDV